ncbi:hypothetical protein ACIRO3_29745 [Streptomyces sp. NPDC102278]|uniref:hypothetical protein n=1 Tax=Streptomyces sp. NPDC102278 TaxID=3366152 RepID=UPI003814CBAA
MADHESGRRDAARRPMRVRLPGFIDAEVGLGDVVKMVTYRAGLRPCAGCEQRAAVLNRWAVFSGRGR